MPTRDLYPASRMVLLWAALVLVFATWLPSQFRTTTGGRAGVGVGQVNPQISRQVNVGLQGTPMTGSVHYAPTSIAMSSEVRQAYWQSGALPSDVRMGFASLGPMTPGGAIDYIPPKPSYLTKPAGAPPAPSGSKAYSTGSIRYAPPALPATGTAQIVSPNLAGTSMSFAAPMSAGAINSGPVNTGSIRYAR